MGRFGEVEARFGCVELEQDSVGYSVWCFRERAGEDVLCLGIQSMRWSRLILILKDER